MDWKDKKQVLQKLAELRIPSGTVIVALAQEVCEAAKTYEYVKPEDVARVREVLAQVESDDNQNRLVPMIYLLGSVGSETILRAHLVAIERDLLASVAAATGADA